MFGIVQFNLYLQSFSEFPAPKFPAILDKKYWIYTIFLLNNSNSHTFFESRTLYYHDDGSSGETVELKKIR